MKKILVGYVDDLKHSGIDKYLLGLLKHSKENDVVFDFLTSVNADKIRDELKKYGSEVYLISNLKKPFVHYGDVRKILEEGNYDAAYFNISEPLNFLGVKAAHDAKVKTLVHSHSAGMDVESSLKRFIRNIINCLCRPFVLKNGDEFFACSETAARWLFGKKTVNSGKCRVVYNSVDTSRFKYSEDFSAELSEEFEIDKDTLVLGHIGHYCYQKNNFFLIDILKEVIKIESNVKMLLVGDGHTRNAVMDYAKAKGVFENTLFLGIRQDIDKVLCLTDVFLLPSQFEGLPIVAVEAQSCGIPCLLSDKIDRLVAFTDSTEFLPISDAKIWAKKIVEMRERKGNVKIFKEKKLLFSESESSKNTFEEIFG